MKKNKLSILGISLGFNSSAALVDCKGNLLRAVSEERLTREKNTKKIPVRSIALVCEKQSVMDVLYYSHYDELDEAYFKKYEPEWHEQHYDSHKSAEHNLLRFVNVKTSFCFSRVERVKHHLAHAFSVYPYYKVPKGSIAVTCDGYGDTISYTVQALEVEAFKKAEASKKYGCLYSLFHTKRNSIALVYQFVTGALGLKMHQHEGKVTGLAAYGDLRSALILLQQFYKKHSSAVTSWRSNHATFEELKDAVFKTCEEYLSFDHEMRGEIREDNPYVTNLCLMAQLFVEKEMLARLDLIPNQENHDLFLAGGLFANVRLNSLISEKTKFKSVNVAPCMGDEGTAVGAALVGAIEEHKLKKLPAGKYSNVFSGVDMGNEQPLGSYPYTFYYDTQKLKDGADIYSYNHRDSSSLVKDIAYLLAEGEIVHRRAGRSEFGPRALCNSTTFYQATNPNGTKVLNQTLGRSEYMPYAPIILAEDVDSIFINDKKLSKSNQYMTATLKIKDEKFKDIYAGAIHVDGTARPQILYDKKSFAYRLLKEYKKRTGLKMLINTSWNIHGNPTVAMYDDSLATWVESGFCGAGLVQEDLFYVKKEVSNRYAWRGDQE